MAKLEASVRMATSGVPPTAVPDFAMVYWSPVSSLIPVMEFGDQIRIAQSNVRKISAAHTAFLQLC